jgi:hypothetical protein
MITSLLLRKAEVRMGNEDRYGSYAELHPVGEKRRANADPLPPARPVAHDGDRQMHLIRMNLGR